MSELPDMTLAVELATLAGISKPVKLTRLAGGRNNKVYQVKLDDGRDVVLKCYHHDERDSRDRLAAEFEFLTYICERNVKTTPKPLVRLNEKWAGLYSFVDGKRIEIEDISTNHILSAADFVRDINAIPRCPRELSAGSEACFSFSDHLETVERRVARLSNLDLDAPLLEEAKAFISLHLQPTWKNVHDHILAAIEGEGLALEEPLGESEICVSPSDFGFHNALSHNGRLTFIDFEYAGFDDPAKLVCDFFCQPQVPVPISLFDRFVDRVKTDLSLPDNHSKRCKILLDAYRVKWICIILNEFLPSEDARRKFSGAVDRSIRCKEQLLCAKKAHNQLLNSRVKNDKIKN